MYPKTRKNLLGIDRGRRAGFESRGALRQLLAPRSQRACDRSPSLPSRINTWDSRSGGCVPRGANPLAHSTSRPPAAITCAHTHAVSVIFFSHPLQSLKFVLTVIIHEPRERCATAVIARADGEACVAF